MRFLCLFLCLLLLSGCSAPSNDTEKTTAPEISETILFTHPPETTPPDPIRLLLNDMSLQERVGQLFLVRCDDAYALEHIQEYHLGGFVLFGRDFQDQSPDSFREKVKSYQAAAKIPLLLAVDEEGGTVTRISSNSSFREKKFPSPRNLYNSGGMEAVLVCEKEKCMLLSSLGIHANLAPVCDIATERSAFMYQRSLGQSPEITADFIRDTVREMDSNKIGSCLKHFPGYGNNADTHTGIAIDSRNLAELESKDLLPFAAGISAGADAILVSHTIVECLDPETPASLSPAVHDYLRNTMCFTGVIVTDDLVMQAITDLYGAGEAAVLAVLAGNDLLCSTEYVVQYEAVYAAVLDGRIDIDTLNNAVRRVLQWKIDLELL